MANRCKSVSSRLDVRCVRRAGHAMAHVYPNHHMKRFDPDYWKALQDTRVVLTLDEICLDDMQDQTFDFERIK